MNNLNLKFRPHVKVDSTNKTTLSIYVGMALALVALASIFFIQKGYITSYQDKIDSSMTEYRQLKAYIGDKDINLNETILNVYNKQYDISVIDGDIYSMTTFAPQGFKYFYLKNGSNVSFKLEVTFLALLSDNSDIKTQLKGFDWARTVLEETPKQDNAKFLLTYTIYLNMGALVYEKN